MSCRSTLDQPTYLYLDGSKPDRQRHVCALTDQSQTVNGQLVFRALVVTSQVGTFLFLVLYILSGFVAVLYGVPRDGGCLLFLCFG